jgi:hypothetical protein
MVARKFDLCEPLTFEEFLSMAATATKTKHPARKTEDHPSMEQTPGGIAKQLAAVEAAAGETEAAYRHAVEATAKGESLDPVQVATIITQAGHTTAQFRMHVERLAERLAAAKVQALGLNFISEDDPELAAELARLQAEREADAAEFRKREQAFLDRAIPLKTQLDNQRNSRGEAMRRAGAVMQETADPELVKQARDGGREAAKTHVFVTSSSTPEGVRARFRNQEKDWMAKVNQAAAKLADPVLGMNWSTDVPAAKPEPRRQNDVSGTIGFSHAIGYIGGRGGVGTPAPGTMGDTSLKPSESTGV